MSRRFLLTMLVILSLGTASVIAWQLYNNHTTKLSPSGHGGSISQNTNPVSPPPANGTQPNSQTPKNYLVHLYFSKHPVSDSDFGATFPVNRTTASLGVARFAISELLKGPTLGEQVAGYFTTVKLHEGASICNGQDFKITIASGIATLQFCRPFDHVGVGSDGQADSELKATLLQFGSVKKVVILNYKGDCEFDLSGLNLCKQ